MRRATLNAPPRFHFAAQAPGRVTLESDTGAVAHVFVLEEDVVRLLVLPDGHVRHPRTWAIAPGTDDVADEGRDRFDTSGFSLPDFALDASDPDRVVVATAAVRLTIGLVNLACRWEIKLDGAWVEAARDRPTQAYDFGWWGGGVRHYLARTPGEQYFGLGEKSGRMDRAGRRLRMNNLDAMGYDAQTSDPLYKHTPFYITRKPETGVCFGLYYDTLSDCVFDLGCEHSNYHGPYRSFEAAHGDLDLYFIAGPRLDAVTRRFTWLTGRPAATPDWALAYSGSTMSYTDAPDAQAQMAHFLDGLERHAIACGSFHLSSGYTSIGDKRYVFNWNRDKFPDPAAFVQSYRDAGVRLIPNIKPALLYDHPQFAACADQGFLISDETGAPVLEQFWDAPGAYLDFTNPATLAWWKAQVKTQLLDYGMAAIWNDNNEFEITSPEARAHGFGAPFAAIEMKPLQTLMMMRASRQAQMEHLPDETPFLVTRAGAVGMQRYAQTWSGDNRTSWKSLKFNIPMGLGLALSGVSNIGHDVGGFAGSKPDPELFARWVGFGVFMPRFSIHSWNDDGSVNEPWMHPEVTDDVRALIDLRTRLTPYLAHILARYRDRYEPAVRPLFYDFPDDPAAWEERSDFMLGSDLMVAPVVEPGAAARDVRLPAGCDWLDFWSGEAHRGGESVIAPTPYAQPPAFIRQGGESQARLEAARG